MARPKHRDDTGIRRLRPRKESESLTEDRRKEIVDRVIRFHDADETARSDEREARLQRYAKYRQWTANLEGPWSDVALPDMMADSQRIQDTLANAVMSARPPITAMALEESGVKKAPNVDRLLDFQFWIENPGEDIVGDMIEAFVNDGHATVFTPWIKESKEIVDAVQFDPIPAEMFPSQFFEAKLRERFADAEIAADDDDSWDWVVKRGGKVYRVSFYTKGSAADAKVEMVTRVIADTFNGPRPIVVEWEDVLHPPRVANLQPPGPSNPNGAPHVILRSYPTIDEITDLRKSGYYDLLDEDGVNALKATSSVEANTDQQKRQKDTMQGVNADAGSERRPDTAGHRTVTRLMCFDRYDIDDDGVAEDVIWWVIKETRTLLRVKRLTEMYPINPPRRPLARKCFIPVGGRATGISLLEQMEPTHDTMKQLLDQTIDNGSISTSPFFFYRAAGGMRPEVIKLAPGEGYPVGDPKNDVSFPTLNTQAVGFGINMMTLLAQSQQRVTMQNELSFGRVPNGNSSALRTVSGMAMVQAQLEARPERILRRFFSLLGEIYAQMHELNEKFLPKDKAIRVMKVKHEGESPFQTIKGADDISGRYDFAFSANAFNTSRQALQQAYAQIMPAYINPLTIQTGVINADGIYRLLTDFGKAWGQDPQQYLTPPSPDSDMPRILAEEAIVAIMGGNKPVGVALEPGGSLEHLQKLLAFMESDDFGRIPEEHTALFAEYLLEVRERAIMEQQRMQQQMMLMQAASQFNAQGGGNPVGRPAETPPQQPGGPAAVSGANELMDESLPGAGGGANPGVA